MSDRATAFVLFQIVLALSFLGAVAGAEQDRPLILVYSQKEPDYARALVEILEDDPRLDGEVLALSDAELLKSMLYFPLVKVVVVVFNHDTNEGIGPHLEAFFRQGGGIVGMGFAGWRTTTGNASETVFALSANVYVAGAYDRDEKVFRHNLTIDHVHEINSGVGSFVANTQKVILHINRSTGSRVPPSKEGELIVLYREPAHGAPAVLVHGTPGACVTFACFAGDSIERAPTYFGRFTGQEEFRTLLRNAVYYAWRNEARFEPTLAVATERFVANDRDLSEMREVASKSERRKESLQMLKLSAVIVIVLVTLGVVYKTCFAAVQTAGDVGTEA